MSAGIVLVSSQSSNLFADCYVVVIAEKLKKQMTMTDMNVAIFASDQNLRLANSLQIH